MKKIVFLLGLLALLTVSRTQAQSMGSDYRTAVGAKFWPGGFTIKHFIRDNRALEGIAYVWEHGFRFTGLYEIHGDINGASGLKWYVGPGAHLGVYNERWRRHGDDDYYDDGDASLGIDGVLGMDYKISGAPINMSLDVTPYLELLNGAYIGAWVGFAVRYTF